MTEIPEHLLKRAQAARQKAAAEAAGEPKIPAHLLERSRVAPERANDPTIPAHLLEQSKPARIPEHLLARSKAARARASGKPSQPSPEPASSSTPLPELPFETNEKPSIKREQRQFSLALLMVMALLVGIGLTIGNFIWHANKDNDWTAAFEKSFFQFISLSVFVFALWRLTNNSSR